jgi:hypothetical protein
MALMTALKSQDNIYNIVFRRWNVRWNATTTPFPSSLQGNQNSDFWYLWTVDSHQGNVYRETKSIYTLLPPPPLSQSVTPLMLLIRVDLQENSAIHDA